jgi:putative nucleotidyltransferase with HDIG domain
METELMRHLEALGRLHGLVHAGDFDELLEAVVREAAAFFGALHAEVLSLEDDRLVLRAAHGLAARPGAPLVIPAQAGLCGEVVRTRQPVCVPDVSADARYAMVDPRTRAEMAAPLIVEGRLYGVLNVEGEDPTVFSGGALELLLPFAALAALALHAAHLRRVEQKRLRDLDLLREFGLGLAAAPDAQAVYDLGVEYAVRLLKASASSLYLYDPASDAGQETSDAPPDALTGLTFASGLPRGSFHPARPGGFTHTVARSGQPLVVNDPASHPLCGPEAAERTGIESIAGFPLAGDGGMIGVLIVSFAHPRQIVSEDVDLLALLAGQLARHIENARLRAAEGRHLAELNALQRVRAALRRAGAPAEIRAVIMDEVTALFHVEAGAIYLPDEGGAHLRPVEARGWAAEQPPPAIADSITGHVYRTGEPYFSRDIRLDPLALPASEDLLPEAAARTIIATPLRVGVEAIGVLAVGADAPRQFTPDDLRLLTTIAEMAGAALHRAGLYEQAEHRARQLSLLNDLGRQMAGTLEPRALCNLAVRALVERFGYALAIVAEVDPSAAELVLAAKAGAATEVLTVGRRAPLAHGIMAHVIRTGQTYLTNRAAQDPLYARWENIIPGSELCVPLRVSGEVIGALNIEQPIPDAFTPTDRDMAESLAAQLSVALANARHFQRMRRTTERLAVFNRATGQVARAPDRRAALAAALEAAWELAQAERGGIFVADKDGRLTLTHAVGVAPEVESALRAQTITTSTGIFGEASRSGRIVEIPDTAADPRVVQFPGYTGRALYCAPLMAGGRPIAILDLDHLPPDDEARALLAAFADRAAVAIENATLYEETARLAQERAALLDMSTSLSGITDLHAVLQRALAHIRATFSVDGCSFTVLTEGGDALKVIAQSYAAPEHSTGEVGELWLLKRLPLSRRALADQRAYAYEDLPSRPELPPEQREWLLRRNQTSSAHIPLVADGQTLGLLYLSVFGRPRRFTAEELSLAQGMANQAAVAIQRAQLYDQTRRRLQRLETLRAIDAAITASVDLRPILAVLLDQATTRLGLHAADVLLLDPHTRTLHYAAGRGFRTRMAEGTQVRLGEGRAGRAALDRRIIAEAGSKLAEPGVQSVAPFPTSGRRPPTATRTGTLAGEGFVAYYAVPLIAKGHVKGVLELFHREAHDPDPEWLEFLEALGAQAAIAIDNASMFSDLQRSHIELSLAYDDTIEGWARALDLRDKETENHTRNVAEMAVRLARALGLPEAELVHIRRGALLHDIGKMAIPDAILLKAGPLTEAEWAVMRQHPEHAHQMLAPIAHLRPALDIPYGHHENWDGSGYPRGLRGEEIPLAARLFAVVDVWDALTSPRLYRAAWPRSKARAYLREQSGKLFEPRIVEMFLALLEGEAL